MTFNAFKQELLKTKEYDVMSEEEIAVKFAKIHVDKALEAAYNNSEMRVSENDTNEHPSFTNNYDDGYVTITVSKYSILNSYPLENIK